MPEVKTISLTSLLQLCDPEPGTTAFPLLYISSGNIIKYCFAGQVLRWYHYFGALWITAFIFACQDVIIAGAVATWYFNR